MLSTLQTIARWQNPRRSMIAPSGKRIHPRCRDPPAQEESWRRIRRWARRSSTSESRRLLTSSMRTWGCRGKSLLISTWRWLTVGRVLNYRLWDRNVGLHDFSCRLMNEMEEWEYIYVVVGWIYLCQVYSFPWLSGKLDLLNGRLSSNGHVNYLFCVIRSVFFAISCLEYDSFRYLLE